MASCAERAEPVSTPCGPDVHVGELDAPVGEQELPDLVGVRHPAGLQDRQHAVVLAVALERADEQPGVDQRGDQLVGGLR